MCARLLGALLFACQIILNGSSVVLENVDSGSVTPTTTRSATLPAGYVTFPDVHAAYKLHEVGTTWEQARDLCEAEGAHLAIADTEEKIVHINSLKSHNEGKWVHVGIHHLKATDQWVRIDNGLPLTSLPWLDDNPDGTGECVGMGILTDTLLDYECDSYDEWFACEISIQEDGAK